MVVTLAWEPALIGTWQSTDDETVIEIAQDEGVPTAFGLSVAFGIRCA
jgi:hypothetical protein